MNTLCKFGVLNLLLALCGVAYATDPAPTGTAVLGNRIGTVWLITGDVTADGGPGKLRHLKPDDIVYVGERLRSAGDGEAVIKLDDAGVMAIRPRSDALFESFLAQKKPTDHQSIRLFAGTLRLITGYIGKLHPAGDKVITSNATLGIRGTDYEPYVLNPDDLAAGSYRAGSYDKVNRGNTTVQITGDPDHVVEVQAGKVGFAPASDATAEGTRGLLTLLLPRILETVPNFYLPGSFDAQLDDYSELADAAIQQRLALVRPTTASCDPRAIATEWLDAFDQAELAKQTASLVELFASDAKIRAIIRSGDGQLTTMNVDRQEFAASATASVTAISDFSQDRSAIDSSLIGDAGQCQRVSVTSRVIEQAKLSGKPYKTSSIETYTLELRDGKWLAIDAQTKQN